MLNINIIIGKKYNYIYLIYIPMYFQFGSGSHLYHSKGSHPGNDIINDLGSKENPTYDNTGHVVLWKDQHSRIVVSFSVGVTLSMRWGGPWINLNVFVSTEHKGKTKGLYGTYDGDADNDLMNRNCTPLWLDIRCGTHQALEDHMSSCK